MNKKLFNNLIASIKEGGAILRGEQEPSRVFVTEDDPRRETFNVRRQESSEGKVEDEGEIVKMKRRGEGGRSLRSVLEED